MVKLSDSELEVMQVIWKKDRITSNEIIQALNNKEWNKNTIRTFINRLLTKKAITICEKNGKQYFYRANIDRKKYISKITEDFVNQYFNGSVINLINSNAKYLREIVIIDEKIEW